MLDTPPQQRCCTSLLGLQLLVELRLLISCLLVVVVVQLVFLVAVVVVHPVLLDIAVAQLIFFNRCC